MTLWFLILLALPASFLLSGLETALLSVSRVRVLHRAKFGDLTDFRLAALCADRENLITSILILNNALTIFVFASVTVGFVSAIGPWGYPLAFALSLPVYLLCGELLPKSICKRAPFRILRRTTPVLGLISLTLLPVVRLVRRGLALVRDGDSGTAIRSGPLAFAGAPESDEARQEFKTLAALMEAQGSLGTTELRMIESVIDFQDATARDLMIPLAKVTSIPVDLPVASLLDLAARTGLDQFPVRNEAGHLVGVVNIFEILRADSPDCSGNVFRFLRKLVRSHPDEHALSVVRRLRRSGHAIAAVSSPGGPALGIVSSTDMVARMVGQRA
ncbi:hypothetical protein BH23VER1_BH23VER1_33850 [soil metagenome]